MKRFITFAISLMMIEVVFNYFGFQHATLFGIALVAALLSEGFFPDR